MNGEEVPLRPGTEDERLGTGKLGFRRLEIGLAFFPGLEDVGTVPFGGDASGGAEEVRNVDGAVGCEIAGLFPGVGRSSSGFSVSMIGRFRGRVFVIVVEAVVEAFSLAGGFCRENRDRSSSGGGLKTPPELDGAALGVPVVGGLGTG